MEISRLKALLKKISSFFCISSCENLDSEPALKYLQKIEEILKLIKPVLNAIVEFDSEITSDEVLIKAYEELSQSVDELRETFESYHPLKSKVCFVLQIESLIVKLRTSGLDIFQSLESFHQPLPDELSLSSLELCGKKLKHTEYEQISGVIKEAIRNQVNGGGPNSESLVHISDCLNLKSNEEILIEAVALEKLKENAEQAERASEAEYIDQLISVVTQIHDRYLTIKQSQSCSHVPIPPDFCCPLSLELMTDPVIVASGQTYERTFIKNWIDSGLTVCPKTRQTLAHTNLIPNYTVKALVANWCDSNHVKLPEPIKPTNFAPSSPLHSHAESGAHKNSHNVPQSRVKSVSSSGEILVDKTGTSRPRSSSEDLSSGVAGNGHGLDIGRLSPANSEAANTEERSVESGGHHTSSPSRREILDGDGDGDGDEDLSHDYHCRSASASSSLSQSILGDTNEVSHASSYSSDASGEVITEPRGLVPLQTRTRSQSIWRRPSERYTPRIVSLPAVETRPDLSGIEAEVRILIDGLKSTSLDDQRDATSEIRLLAKNTMDNRIAIANCGAISLLVNLLHSADAKIQENAVTALLNLSINDNNKTAIASADAIEPLILVLKTGSSEAKENAAATLFSLSVIEDNKIRIGRSGAIGPLVDLLGNGTPRGKKDAATALFNLSLFHENKIRIVQAGAVKYLVELMDPAAGMVDKAVAVLANLSTIQDGRTAIGQERGIPVLVEVVELGSSRGKENAAAALLQLCTNSSRFCTLVLQEGAVPPLVALSQSGTARAKEKAQALLSYFRSQRQNNAGRG